MQINEAVDLSRTSKMRCTQTRSLAVLVVTSTLITGCVRVSTPGTSHRPAQQGDLVYDVCMEMHAGTAGDQMLSIVCEVIAEACKADPGGDGCKGPLRKIDEKMKASGSSMLFVAAHAGRTDIARTMIAMGSDPNAPVATGWTPLLIAAAEGHGATVVALLEAGADPNVKNRLGRTALMFASTYGFTSIVNDLLAGGADPNVAPADGQGWTALMVAARTGHVETVHALLAGGADLGLTDNSGNTALTLAEAEGHSTVARVLREHGGGR